MAKTMAVEVGRVWAGSEGDSGDWDVYPYDIPADTPEGLVDETALKEARRVIESGDRAALLVHLFIYSISPQDEDEENEENP